MPTMLQVLEAANMPLLSSVSPLAFLSLSNLTRVSLATNRRLAPLPPGVWTPCPALAHLDLSSAPWTHLTQDQLPAHPTKIIMAGGIMSTINYQQWRFCSKNIHPSGFGGL